ncbi:MAG: Rieske (2Fe-2S) protein [Chromatiaceae bacterium]|nr:Rieske (2Fe-2S) protein [Gammaproteobacteria bacterium]MCP5300407.1 Rieske (2Fe-2S) protein [Chromatiaceae bacterium]MCP5422479.1 Rieske (2Fe-2S) protein [Chromatiaceae bacterium]
MHVLCASADVPEPGSRGFAIDVGGETPLRLFVVRKDGRVTAYRNSCPHTGAPLEWQPDQFLDLDNSFIQCSIHGALFRTEDGLCLRGPCVGQSLRALSVRVDSGRLVVDLPVEDRGSGTD